MTDSFTPSTPPGEPAREDHPEQGQPVVRDRRRLDPTTGQLREPAQAPGPDVGPAGSGDPAAAPEPDGSAASDVDPVAEQADATALLSAAEALAADRLGDLQRLQAEYVNYRRRVERDREAVREAAVVSALEGLLPVLDDIHLARQHGDLDGGPFAAIAEKLETALARLGLERYGAVGEVFDPAVHEALMNGVDESGEATDTVVTQVLQPGYRMAGAGSRVLRAARVAVVSPA